MTQYERIEQAILYIIENFRQQPDLDTIAKHLHLSPFHFQRLFREWAGVSPKKFLQYISIEYAKGLLKQNDSLLDVSLETGLSGTSRLHDLFMTVEGMTPGNFKRGAYNLSINFSFSETPFGKVIIASTQKGVCHLSFCVDEQLGLRNLKVAYPNAKFTHRMDQFQQKALRIFSDDWSDLSRIRLHLKGTPFQLKVWETLLRIPFGCFTSYKAVASHINLPRANQAVGTAIGENPIAYLIPCHRVIKATGIIGNYRWGSARKIAMIGWEAAKSRYMT